MDNDYYYLTYNDSDGDLPEIFCFLPYDVVKSKSDKSRSVVLTNCLISDKMGVRRL